MEHERQRALQRRMFENQMRALEQQQQQELLSIPYDPNSQQVAMSAPTTPPRQNGALPTDAAGYPVNMSGGKVVDVDALSTAVVSATSEKRKSVRYAPDSPEAIHPSSGFARIGHKSMPASRRTSASEHDEDLAGHLQNLSLIGERNDKAQHPLTPSLSLNGGKFGDAATAYNTGFNAGVLLDEQLDQEMHSQCQLSICCMSYSFIWQMLCVTFRHRPTTSFRTVPRSRRPRWTLHRRTLTGLTTASGPHPTSRPE
jgi:hypothetical protein